MAEAVAAACRDRDRRREIGRHAADEIYLSWDDAVAKAVRRYRTVIERYTREKRSRLLENEMRELKAEFEKRKNLYIRRYYRFGRQLIEGKGPRLALKLLSSGKDKKDE